MLRIGVTFGFWSHLFVQPRAVCMPQRAEAAAGSGAGAHFLMDGLVFRAYGFRPLGYRAAGVRNTARADFGTQTYAG